MAIARMGSAQDIPVILLRESLDIPTDGLVETGIVLAHSIASGPMCLEDIMVPDIAFHALKGNATHYYLFSKSLQKNPGI